MAASRVRGEIGVSELVYIHFYRLRSMSQEEKLAWTKQWAEMKAALPKGIRVLAESDNAFSTAFSGFTVYEGSLDQWEKTMKHILQSAGHVLEASMTVMGTKGTALPTAELKSIVEARPVD